ncbi:hypothetical protein PISMIDRAFT_673209, partial [Pisolithus microcarpus 441]
MNYRSRSRPGQVKDSPTFPCVFRPTKHSKVHHRTQPRLVFQEVRQLHSVDTVFATLEDARKALQFLHSVDGAHRDVGAGDVLRSGKIGKLADLEYAKRVDSNTTHEVRTGTLDFMACELEAQKYL